MTAPALRLVGVDVAYRDRLALRDVTVEHRHGRRLGVVGPNGAGKSTLARLVVGLLRPTRGRVEVEGLPAHRARGRVAYLPQRAQVDLEHPVRVRDVVAMGRYPARGPVGRLRREDHAAIEAALARVDLARHGATRLGELSGGQQQRAFLARALAQRADVLLLDEPHAGLDATTCAIIDRELERAAGEGAAVVVVDHDLLGLHGRYDEVLVLQQGVVAFGPPGEAVTPEVLASAYGHGAVLLGPEGRP